MTSQPRKWRPAVPALFIAAATLAACSSPPPPTAALDRARTAIEGAQLDGAQELAPAQLQSAQNKLSSAQAAVGQKDMDQAKYLAEEAEMEAINAEQIALAQKAVNVQAELQRTSPAFQRGMTGQEGSATAPAPRRQRTQKPPTQ